MKNWKKNLMALAVLLTVCSGIYLNWLYTEDTTTANLTDTLDAEKVMSEDTLVLSEDLAALAAGAGVNLALALCFGFLPQYRFQLFSAINLVMGGFNLLPIQGLDGGRMLRLGLERFCGPLRAAKWCAFLSFAVLAALWGWGLWMWRQYPGLPALLGVPLLAAAVFFDWCKKQ